MLKKCIESVVKWWFMSRKFWDSPSTSYQFGLMDTKRTLSAKELLQWNSKSNANQRINEVEAAFCEILEKNQKKTKETGSWSADSSPSKKLTPSWPNSSFIAFYVTVSCEILTRSQHKNLFKPYTLMQFYDSRPPVLWSKWPLASSLLQAIKTCRQACPPGYLMHFL